MTPTPTRRKLRHWRLAQTLAHLLLPQEAVDDLDDPNGLPLDRDEIAPGYAYALGTLSGTLERLPYVALLVLRKIIPND